MIESATEVYLLADSTKFGKTSLAILGGIEMADCIVTDAAISDVNREFCEKRGVRVIIA